MSRDKDRDPNSFAVALGEVMALDGVTRADFKYKDTLVSITRDEVPFVKTLVSAAPKAAAASLIRLGPQSQGAVSNDVPAGVEDEDQDWVSLLEASDHSPRDADVNPSGYINPLVVIGEFEFVAQRDGSKDLRFNPHDNLIAPYFIVTSNAYETDPTENVEYEVTGNVTLNSDRPASIEILSINPVGEALVQRSSRQGF